MTKPTVTLVRHEDIRPGDWLGLGGFGSERHGPVVYVNLDTETLTFHDGTQTAVQRGSSWPVENYRPAKEST